MARARRKRSAANGDFPTEPIVIALTPAIKARLKSKGRYSNRRMVRLLRVVYQNGKITITGHMKGTRLTRGAQFVSSNSTFA